MDGSLISLQSQTTTLLKLLYRRAADADTREQNRVHKDRLSQARLILPWQFTAQFAALGRRILGPGDALTGFQAVSQANAAGAFLEAMQQLDKVSAYVYKPLNTK